MMKTPSPDVSNRRTDLAACALLSLLGFAGLSSLLHLIPSLSDDLMIFSAAVRAPHPFVFFVQDWGTGGSLYRPLLTLSFWLVHRIAGLSGFANGLASMATQILVACLVYKIVRRSHREAVDAFLLAALALFSSYVAGVLVLPTDRSAQFVAVFFLLLIHHLLGCAETGGAPRLPYVVALSLLALMSKENGLVVPVTAAAWPVLSSPSRGARRLFSRTSVVLGVVAFAYVLFRHAIFEASAFQYGGIATSAGSGLPGIGDPAAYARTVLRNIAEPFFPTHALDLRPASLLTRVPVLVLTVLLWGSALRRPLSRLQAVVLVAILVNAALHPVVWYRLIYLSHLALLVFVGLSSVPATRKRALCFRVSAFLLIVFGIHSTTGHIQDAVRFRLSLLQSYQADRKAGAGVEPAVMGELLSRYPPFCQD